MSRYLISRIEACREITLEEWTEIEALEGDAHLERCAGGNAQTGVKETHEIQHLFLMTGACPNTAWLGGCLALDTKQFIKTGADVGPTGRFGARRICSKRAFPACSRWEMSGPAA